MGREVRKVPPHWEHPIQEGWSDGRLQPMYDESYQRARGEWLCGLAGWTRTDEDYWESEGNPPNRAYYRPWQDDEATWFQVWETVSEGTPVTPPFPTREQLAEYLYTHGDKWDQKRGAGPWSRESAIEFVFNDGYVPSLVVVNGRVIEGRDVPAELPRCRGKEDGQ